MKVYLDNSATTRPRDEVIDEMVYYLKTAYGNPSSLHRMGLEVEKRIKESRNIVADYLKVKSKEIFFTSGGTESNNIAIQGIINKFSKRGNHIITTKIEHASVLNIFKAYEQKGFHVTYLDVDEKGTIDLEQLKGALTDQTILVSVMMVNNEVGTLQPMKEVRQILDDNNKRTKLHVDGIQAFGKIEFDLNELGIDTFAFSGHKFHGPKGIGGLYVKENLTLQPLVFGGNQERGLRSGTENVPGIIGLGKAVDSLKKNFKEEKETLVELKSYFIKSLEGAIDQIKVNSYTDEKCTPHIVNVSFLGVRGEVLLHYLEEYDIFVSTGSACASTKNSKSHVLKAMGLSDKELEGPVRFSFAYSTTIEEIDYAIEKLKVSVEEIRQIMMR